MIFSRALGTFVLAFITPLLAAAEMKVVTTLPTYASIASTIGGNRIKVSSVASPRFNPHFIEPRPSDVLRLKRADLFIHSGLDLEAWRQPLVDAAASPEIRPGGAKELNLSQGISLIDVPVGAVSRSQGDIHLYGNPHYWMNPRNGLVIADAIAQKLAAIDPDGAQEFQANSSAFKAALSQKIQEWSASSTAFKGKQVIGYHNEWIYLMRFLGLEMPHFLEPKPGVPPTPKHIEFLKSFMKENNVRAVIQSSYSPSDAADDLARDTGAAVVKLCQSVGELEPCADYQSMLEFDIRSLLQALHG